MRRRCGRNLDLTGLPVPAGPNAPSGQGGACRRSSYFGEYPVAEPAASLVLATHRRAANICGLRYHDRVILRNPEGIFMKSSGGRG